jgi:hypothetical protein
MSAYAPIRSKKGIEGLSFKGENFKEQNLGARIAVLSEPIFS